ncbi:MAG TPA: ATPase, T2SS/T4P/T4SS family [archaeon]|nr:ATPase, T2SS/T4P/T4SS family [archaeon]
MPNYMDDLFEKVKKKDSSKGQKNPSKSPEKIPSGTETKISLAKKEARENISKKQKIPDDSLEDLSQKISGIKKAIEKVSEEKTEEEKSQIVRELEKAKKEEIESYGNTKIYRLPNQPLLYYSTPVARPGGSEKAIINTIKEAATRIISIAPYKIRDVEQRKNVYYQRILEIIKNSPELNIPRVKYEFYAEAVVREMIGYGIIDALINDDSLEEIMIIGPNTPVYVFHRKYEMMITNIEFYSDTEIQDLTNRIARQIGRRVDIASPLLDARLADGSRVNATLPPATVGGSTLTIRKFREDPFTILELIKSKTLDSKTAAFLWVATEGLQARPANILIAGGTGSGKTTTLNVLAAFIPETERIISIEDTAELSLPIKHWIRMEARPPGLEGTGELTLDILTKNSLRMRPDRIIVGEIRHDEAFALFTAFNTGHDGSLGTVHANSPQETIIRVTSPPMNVPEPMLSGLNFILVQHRLHDKKMGTIRRITEIAEVTGALKGKPMARTIFKWDPKDDLIKRTDEPMEYMILLQEMTGLSRQQIENEIEERAKFLKKLAGEDVSGMKSVSERMKGYLLEKR